MSQQSFLAFLKNARDNVAMLACYNQRNLSQLLFHAGNEGFDFTVEDVAQVVGMLEANVILILDQDHFDGTSHLWRHMWGRYHFEYLVNHVVSRHSDEQLQVLIERHEAEHLAPIQTEPTKLTRIETIKPLESRKVIDFLRIVAARVDMLDSLKTKSKDEVFAIAAAFGFPFTSLEFDSLIWDLEAHLAVKRGEPFTAHFSLWQTMWGKYYLEYLVVDLLPSCEELDVAAILTATARIATWKYQF